MIRKPAPGPTARRRRSSFDPVPDWAGPGTRLVHGARRKDRNAGAVVPPIYQTSTFHYPPEFSPALESGDVHNYTRTDNPTQEVAAELVRQAERADAARVFSSGMGAIASTMLALLSSGDEVVAIRDLYGGTLNLFQRVLPRLGIKVNWVTPNQAGDPGQSFRSNTRVAYLESPTNPILSVHDIRQWADAAKASGALLVVDNTFATPVNQNPLALGADLVIHSATKYLGGHSDLIAGAIAGRSGLLEKIDEVIEATGPTLDPFGAYLLTRGLRTLALRVSRQNENGRLLVKALENHPRISRVDYPGRRSTMEESIAMRQMRGRGGVLSITLRGGRPGAIRFLKRLKLIHVASSLGGVESLASMPSETSHHRLSADELRARGIEPGLVRLALGIEEADDLIRDVREALEGE